MQMPEASVHEDHGAVFRQHNVGFAGKSAVQGAVDREAVSGAMKKGADKALRLGVPAPDTGHVPTALFGCERIGHPDNLASETGWCNGTLTFPIVFDPVKQTIQNFVFDRITG